jgi:predicted DNA repair protein MutK
MSGGLVALLDDVAALARVTAASVDDIGAAAGRASMKAAGVVVDDTAVTPQYVHGISPARELPIIWRITKGSLRNKLVFILPVALLLSQFAPWLLTPILMLGGSYLCFEGAEKIWAKLSGHGAKTKTPVVQKGKEAEDTMVGGAVRTDLILSAEIMVISLNEVAEETLLSRAAILVVVAIGITALVYGVVALIIRMDDFGLHLAERTSPGAQKVGRGLVKGMPVLLTGISVVGTAAMLWVGGHIILVGVDELGWHAPYEAVHHVEVLVHDAVAGGLGAALAWLTNTFFSAVLGVLWGAVLVLVWELLPFGKGEHEADHAEHGAHEAAAEHHGRHSAAASPAEDGTSAPDGPASPTDGGGSTAAR